MMPGHIDLPCRTKEEAIEYLNQKIALIEKVCESIARVFTLDLERTLALVKAPPLAEYQAQHTPEMLIQAQTQVEKCRDRLQQFREAVEAAPPEIQAVLSTGASWMLEDALKQAEAYRDHIQQELEGGSLGIGFAE